MLRDRFKEIAPDPEMALNAEGMTLITLHPRLSELIGRLIDFIEQSEEFKMHSKGVVLTVCEGWVVTAVALGDTPTEFSDETGYRIILCEFRDRNKVLSVKDGKIERLQMTLQDIDHVLANIGTHREE